MALSGLTGSAKFCSIASKILVNDFTLSVRAASSESFGEPPVPGGGGAWASRKLVVRAHKMMKRGTEIYARRDRIELRPPADFSIALSKLFWPRMNADAHR